MMEKDVKWQVLYRLTGIQPSEMAKRRMMVLKMLSHGWKEQEIAHELHVTIPTAKRDIRFIRERLDARNIPHLISIAYEKGILGGEPHMQIPDSEYEKFQKILESRALNFGMSVPEYLDKIWYHAQATKSGEYMAMLIKDILKTAYTTGKIEVRGD